jgi:hypothetical protein
MSQRINDISQNVKITKYLNLETYSYEESIAS